MTRLINDVQENVRRFNQEEAVWQRFATRRAMRNRLLRLLRSLGSSPALTKARSARLVRSGAGDTSFRLHRGTVAVISAEAVERLILTVREQKVILDRDLAALYGVTTKRLNEQFRRNRKRFPEDFAFQLTAQEVAEIRSQIATSSSAARL